MAIEDIVAEPLSLQHARASLGLTKTALAKMAGVNRSTIVDCENGNTIRLETAWKILNALNVERHRQLKPRLTIKQLTWSIRGEGKE